MNLKTYCKTYRGQQQVIASAAGVTQSRVSQWVSGELIPLEKLHLVIAATNYKCKAQDLRPDVDWSLLIQGARNGENSNR